MVNGIFCVTFCIVQSFVLSMHEIRNASYAELDFRFTYELCSVPIKIGESYDTHTMGQWELSNIKKSIIMLVLDVYHL